MENADVDVAVDAGAVDVDVGAVDVGAVDAVDADAGVGVETADCGGGYCSVGSSWTH